MRIKIRLSLSSEYGFVTLKQIEVKRLFRIIYSKQFVIGVGIIGFALLLNRYSLLFDFFFGLLLSAGTMLVLAGLLSKFRVMNKLRVIKGKYLNRFAR